jgi:TonB family protein
MKRSGLMLAALSLGAAIAAAQQQPIPAPQPAADGTYFVGPQVTAPRLAKVMAAGYPNDVRVKDVAGFTVLSTVIDVKGIPTQIEVLHTHGADFDASAINAVKLCRFAPGQLLDPGSSTQDLTGKLVPVRIDVRIPFHANGAQAVPVVVIAERDLNPIDPIKRASQKRPPSYTPPIPIHIVDADFIDPAAKTTYEGIALVSVDVSAEGLPTSVRIKRGLGFGTDAKAVAAVQQYRFLPATDHGKPVAASREVEVKFAIF